MRYLLEVNALVALSLLQHEFHQQVARWVKSLGSAGVAELSTCSITELGFVRVVAQASNMDLTSRKRALLLRMKSENILKFTLIADDPGVAHLPGWFKTAKQGTRIQGAFVIPTGK